MALDLILRNACIGRREPRIVDIAIAGGRIVEIASAHRRGWPPEEDLGGRLVVAGFVETHIHLDKSCILDRCKSQQGTLAEAIAEVAAAKRDFTEDDVYQRAPPHAWKSRSCKAPCACARHVEVDPRIGLKGFHAIRRLQAGLRLGDRHRNLRVSAGRVAQRSRHRGDC